MAQSWLVFHLTGSAAKLLGALLAMRWRPRDELAERIRYVRGHEALWVPTLIAYDVAVLAMAYSRLLPVFATDVLHAGVREYGWLLAAPGLGAMCAAFGHSAHFGSAFCVIATVRASPSSPARCHVSLSPRPSP